ncbi:MAG: phage portal protein, partial [Candidatus Sulfotelmatobacter sp.]
PDQARRLREEWDQIYNGDGQGRTAILEEGVKFEPLSFRATDAQFLESRKYQAEETARIFRVWSFLIGLMEKLSYNNVEHLMKLHVDSTLAPLSELITAAYAFTFELGILRFSAICA